MINLKAVLYIIGLLISIMGLTMFVPAIFEYILGDNKKVILTFISLGSLGLIIGGSFSLAFKSNNMKVSIKDTFILTSFSWLLLCFFSALPFWFILPISFIDAFFEATSGLTTTGATVFSNLDTMSKGLLFWRSLLQWLGGLGIIVLAIAILPILSIGGMQLFNNNWNDNPDTLKYKAKELTKILGTTYLLLTFICGILLWFAGLSTFDSICHSMTTIATGGFSTHDTSIGFFNSIYVEIIIIVGMIMSSLPFMLYFKGLNKKNLIFKDPQVKLFLFLAFFFVLIIAIWLTNHKDIPFLTALRLSSFNSISIMTGTGYATSNFTNWGTFAVSVMLFMMLIGGCTGSTTGGLKIFRIQVLFALIIREVKKIASPRAITKVNFAGKPLEEKVIASIMILVIVFFISIAIVSISLSLYGYDLITSISAGASAIAIVGPGLGAIIGPAHNFASLPDNIKIILALAMLLGRLEFIAVLVVLRPKFWLK